MPYKIDIAWAAGFFDGEGCTSVTNALRRSRLVAISITQKDRRVLDRFAKVVGDGRVYGPYLDGKGQRVRYQYHANGGQRVAEIIAKLWPYLGDLKREQAMRALADWGEREPQVLEGNGSRRRRTHCPNGHEYGPDEMSGRNDRLRCPTCKSERYARAERAKVGG